MHEDVTSSLLFGVVVMIIKTIVDFFIEKLIFERKNLCSDVRIVQTSKSINYSKEKK